MGYLTIVLAKEGPLFVPSVLGQILWHGLDWQIRETLSGPRALHEHFLLVSKPARDFTFGDLVRVVTEKTYRGRPDRTV